MIFIHANLYTMEERDFEDGFLWVEGSRIKAVGSMDELPEIPEEETVVDAEGFSIMPGMIDAHSHLGMWEDSLTFEGDDGNEETDPVTPQLRAIDAVNPMDRCFHEAALGGITTVLTGPGSANAIAGSWCAMKTMGHRVDTMALVTEIGMKFALGENPKHVYHGRDEAPFTRMATAALIREELKKAKRYHKAMKRCKKNPEEDKPEFEAKSAALVPVLKRKQKAFFHAHRADDLFTAIRIAKEFDLDAVLVHATEGHLIAEDLKTEGYPVITGPILCDRSKPELRNLTIENPAKLAAAGVLQAICTDHPVIPIQYLPLSAGLAIRGGLSRKEAMRMITRNPAVICGLDDRIGSLKAGKDADFVIFEGDPFTVYFKPEKVYINGCLVNQQED